MRKSLSILIALIIAILSAASAAQAHNEWAWQNIDNEATYVAPTTIYASNLRWFTGSYQCPFYVYVPPHSGPYWIGKGYVDASTGPNWTQYRGWGFAIFQNYHWHRAGDYWDTGFSTQQIGGWFWWPGQYDEGALLNTRRVYSDTHPYDNSSVELWIKAVNNSNAHFDIQVC